MKRFSILQALIFLVLTIHTGSSKDVNARLLRKWAAAKAAKSKKSGIVSPVKSPKIPVRPSPALRPASPVSPVSPVSESPRPITKFINPISRFLTRRLSKTPSQSHYSSPMTHRSSPPPTPPSKTVNQIQTTRQPIQ
jgi:hypothetical protein